MQWFQTWQDSSRQVVGEATLYFRGLGAFQDAKNKYCFEDQGDYKETFSKPNVFYSLKLKDNYGQVSRIPRCGTNELTMSDITEHTFYNSGFQFNFIRQKVVFF